MKNQNSKYLVTPGVVQTGVKTLVTITPLESNYYFSETHEYEIAIHPMTTKRELEADIPDFVLKGMGGILEFEYSFAGEGEYYIKIFGREDGIRQDKIVILSIYAVRDDLFVLRPLRGDLHIHTIRSDGKEMPGIVAANYRAAGFDFIAITDHNRYFPSVEAQEFVANFDTDFTVLNGEEVHTPGSSVHIVHVGGRSSVAEKYVRQGEQFEADIEKIESGLAEDKYTKKLARAIWATENIHDAGGIAIFPHPYWINDVYNVPDELIVILLRSGMFDAYELIGGMEIGGNNLSVAKYNDLRVDGLNIPVVASSDSHGTVDYPRFGSYYTVLFAAENSRDSIITAVKNGLSVAVEAVEGTGGKNYRVYGGYRLVSYARYLIDNYFTETERLYVSQGKYMRDSLIGIPGALDAANACSKYSRKFYDMFFGKLPAVKPDAKALDTAEKWQQVWNDYGVIKKGSAIK